MIPQYAVDPSITEVLVTDCVRLYAAMVPPVRCLSSRPLVAERRHSETISRSYS